jgi:hypothetical protein
MRGCLRRWRVKGKDGVIRDHDKKGLEKGAHSWDIIIGKRWTRFNGTKKAAEARLRELAGKRDRGEFIEASKVTVGEYLNDWLDTAIKPRRAANTYNLYKTIIKNYLKPALGHIPLQRLTAMDVQRYYAEPVAEVRQDQEPDVLRRDEAASSFCTHDRFERRCEGRIAQSECHEGRQQQAMCPQYGRCVEERLGDRRGETVCRYGEAGG